MELLTDYGAAALFGIVALSSIGVPLPSSLVLPAAGSFVAGSQMC